MSNPFVPNAPIEQEIREAQEQEEQHVAHVLPREEEWQPGMVCLHPKAFLSINGHCGICGDCRDEALCHIGQDAMNRPENFPYTSIIMPLRRHAGPIFTLAAIVYYIAWYLL